MLLSYFRKKIRVIGLENKNKPSEYEVQRDLLTTASNLILTGAIVVLMMTQISTALTGKIENVELVTALGIFIAVALLLFVLDRFRKRWIPKGFESKNSASIQLGE